MLSSWAGRTAREMKIYDLVKKLLEEKPERRDSDKQLIWAVWYTLGFAETSYISFTKFVSGSCPSAETIRRCRQKIQEKHPELQATLGARRIRQSKQAEKGTFIYREQTEPIAAQNLEYESYIGKNGMRFYRPISK